MDNNVKEFILYVIAKLEAIWTDMFIYSYHDGNKNMTETWWIISVSNYEVYSKDKRFKALSQALYKVGKKKGYKIVFVCGWIPTEQRMNELLKQNNLIINV